MILEHCASRTPSTHNKGLPALKKRTDRKKAPFFGRFGRKTGVWRREKNTLFCTFARFRGFLLLQVVGHKCLPESLPPEKKSCLKTYGRFYDFGRMCHDDRMNIKKVAALQNGGGIPWLFARSQAARNLFPGSQGTAWVVSHPTLIGHPSVFDPSPIRVQSDLIRPNPT
jgi:hypothetical protein